jgi:NADP-dependent 3-hydroxy acid dehydrogenase YdfG
VNSFQNKLVLITGASAGFGAETARLFAQAGARLILIARRQERLQQLAQELQDQYGTPSHVLALDVTNYDQVSKSLSELPPSFETPDILINNAGLVRGRAKLWETEEDEWNQMIDTNIKGILSVSRHILPKMIKANQGHIINVGSTSGHGVYPGGSVYCATKYAVRALTDTLRMELVDTPLRVSLISPGMAKTEFSLVRFYGDESKAEQTYEGIDALTAQDIAESILFIASRPPHVNVADLILYPTNQASSTLIYRQQAKT